MKVSRPSIWPVAFYTALAGGAFALRMYNIGQQPVWTDEVTTIEPIRRLAFWEFARIQAQIDPNPPLYHLLAYGWGRLGDSVEWIRALSAVFGALTVPALYRLAREGLGRWASLLAALFVCFTPLHIHLSQQARYPAFLGLMSVLSALYFVRFLDTGSKIDRHRYILCTAAMLYTHAFAVLVLAIEGLVTLFNVRRTRSIGGLFLAWAIVALLFLPWLPHTLHQAGAYHGAVALFPMPLVLSLTPVYITMGYTDWHPPLRLPLLVSDALKLENFDIGLHLLILAAALAPVGLAWLIGLIRKREYGAGPKYVKLAFPLAMMLYLGAIFLVSLAVGHGWMKQPLSLFKPYYMVVFVPMSALLAASGAEAVSRKSRVAALLLAGLVSVPMAAGVWEYERPLILKEDWRGAARVISEQARPGDGVLVPNRIHELCFNLYFDTHIPVRKVTGFDPREDSTEPVAVSQVAVDRAFDRFVSDLERVWIVNAYPDQTDPERVFRNEVESMLYPITYGSFSGNDPQLNPRFKLSLYTTRPEILWAEFSSRIDFLAGDFHPMQLGPGWAEQGQEWRWMGLKSKSWLRWPDGTDRLTAEVFVNPAHFGKVPFFVHMVAEGRILNSLFVNCAGIFEISADLPRDLQRRPIMEVELISEQFFVSDEVYGDGDMEPKSINVRRIALE